MQLYKYNNYEEYVRIQTEGNKSKLGFSYVDPVSIDMVVNYVHNKLNIVPNKIICHGTRRGLEMDYFDESLKKLGINSDIIGTEISDTATTFKRTIQWDFHNVKDEWVNNIDIIYSNSFDHSYEPEKCLDAWMKCLTNDGVCIIEYSFRWDVNSTRLDPFGASLEEYKQMINKNYQIVDIIDNNGLEDKGLTEFLRSRRFFIIIKNK